MTDDGKSHCLVLDFDGQAKEGIAAAIPHDVDQIIRLADRDKPNDLIHVMHVPADLRAITEVAESKARWLILHRGPERQEPDSDVGYGFDGIDGDDVIPFQGDRWCFESSRNKKRGQR